MSKNFWKEVVNKMHKFTQFYRFLIPAYQVNERKSFKFPTFKLENNARVFIIKIQK
jgi:hypothetical protein